MNATERVATQVGAVDALKSFIEGGGSVETFCKRTKIKPEAVGRWTGGQNLPTFRTAERVLAALKRLA